MSAVTTETRAKVKQLVCDVLEIEPDELTDTSLFVDDHEADSMQAIEILSNLEITFDTRIEQSELERMVNLAGIYDVLEEALAARS